MKKLLLFIVLLCVVFWYGYGQTSIPYTKAFQSSLLGGTINDIYITKIPRSTDSIYVSVEGIGVKTLNMSGVIAFSPVVSNTNSNLRLQVVDIFKTGKPDLAISNIKSDNSTETSFTFYKELTISSSRTYVGLENIHTFEWKPSVIDTFPYLLATTRRSGTQDCKLYELRTDLVFKLQINRADKDANMLSAFINAHNNSRVDVLTTGKVNNPYSETPPLYSFSRLYHNNQNGFGGEENSNLLGTFGYTDGKILTGDIDDNGWEDVVIMGQEMHSSNGTLQKKIIKWFKNDGNGIFSNGCDIIEISDVANSDFVLGDFNYDGKVDICVAANNNLTIYLQDTPSSFVTQSVSSLGTGSNKHRIGLWANKLLNGKIRLDIFVSSNNTLYRFYQENNNVPVFTLPKPDNLSIYSISKAENPDNGATIGKDITVQWSKVDKAVSYDGYLEIQSEDGNRNKILLHKSIPLAIHGNLGNGNIEGNTITNIKKAKFFIPQNIYTQYENGTATIRLWSVDGAYRRSTDSATISIVIPPINPPTDPLPPTDSICPSCPTNPENPDNVYRRPRVKMVSADTTRSASDKTANMLKVTLKSQLTATGWDRPLKDAGFYFSTDSATVANLTLEGTNQKNLPQTSIPNPITSGLILDSVNVGGKPLDSLILRKIISDRSSLLSGTKYYVRAFAANGAGPVFSSKKNIINFTTQKQTGFVDPELPPTDSLPGREDEDDNGNIDTIPVPPGTIDNGDIPIFYKRSPQAYPYQIMRDSIKIMANRVPTTRPVRLNFKVADPFATSENPSNYIKNNKSWLSGDSVVIQTLKTKTDGLTGIAVEAREYDTGIIAPRTLKIFPKYRLQQHFVAGIRRINPNDNDTVMFKKGNFMRSSNDNQSASRMDTLTILINARPTANLIPNQQKSIPLSQYVVSSSYNMIHSSFPTVDTVYLDTVSPARTHYYFNTPSSTGISGRFEIQQGVFKFLPKDTTFTVFAENDGNDFFKPLNDSLFIRIRLSHVINQLPDPGPGIDDDEVTVVVPGEDGSLDTIRISGFPTDGIRTFYQNNRNPYTLPNTPVTITTTIITRDSQIMVKQDRIPIRFMIQTPATGAYFSMNGNAILMQNINTSLWHSSTSNIRYIHQDSVWIEPINRSFKQRVRLYMISKQIYDYKVKNSTRYNNSSGTLRDEMKMVGDTINIIKSATNTTYPRRFTSALIFDPTGALNPATFSNEQKKHLYPANIHENKMPKLSIATAGTGAEFVLDVPVDGNTITVNYGSNRATDSRIFLKGDSIHFFRQTPTPKQIQTHTERLLTLRIRQFDSIPSNILDRLGVRADSVLRWCSVTDSVHPTPLSGTTTSGRSVLFQVLQEYRHIAQLQTDNKIKMLDTGWVTIRAYVNDDPTSDLPGLEQFLQFRIFACPEMVRSTSIQWIKPTADTIMSSLYRNPVEIKAIVPEFSRGTIHYEIVEGFEQGFLNPTNILNLQGTTGPIRLRASYAGSVFYKPSEKFLMIDVQRIRMVQRVVEKTPQDTPFETSNSLKAEATTGVEPPYAYSKSLILRNHFEARDSIEDEKLPNAVLHYELSVATVNGRIIPDFPNQDKGHPYLNEDSTELKYSQVVGAPVRLTITAKGNNDYKISQPYIKNILIVGDKQDPSLILPEYPGKDCFDVKAELKKHYVTEYNYVDIAIYNRYSSNVLNLQAKNADENCLQEIQKLPDGVYLCVMFVGGNKSMPYCSYITILRSK